MIIELKTRRRWIVSVLAAVAEAEAARPPARVAAKPSARRLRPGEKGFASRLKAATRAMAPAD
ncbi:hypothetical protein [Tabrizicola sp.]|uniref:hypothetical protein n=1 Tax=Tabrizicola sp. TaxID=2005166 RepID=UPI0035B40C50